MGQYRAKADITVNAKLVKTGATFSAKPEEAQGFIANGQAEVVSEKPVILNKTTGKPVKAKKGR